LSICTDVDYRLWISLALARDALLAARRVELAKRRISAIEFFALFVLNDIDEVTIVARITTT